MLAVCGAILAVGVAKELFTTYLLPFEIVVEGMWRSANAQGTLGLALGRLALLD